jgi:RHS repeat-associated protein
MSRRIYSFIATIVVAGGLHSTAEAQGGHASGVPVRMWIKAQAQNVAYNNFGYVAWWSYLGQVYSAPDNVYYFDHSEWRQYSGVNYQVFIYRYSLGTQSTVYGRLEVTGTFLESSQNANDGTVTASVSGTAAGEIVTLPLGSNGSVRMEPGKSYNIAVTQTGLSGGTLHIASPPQYRVIVNDVPRNTCSLVGGMTISLLPVNEAPVGPAGFASTVGGSRIDWRISLGALHNGDDAGSLRLLDSGLAADWTSLFTPAGLHYESVSDEIFVYRQSGMIRQIICNQVAVDVQTASSTSYEVRCYVPAQMLGSSLPCGFSGEPFVVYRIEKDTSAPTPATALKFTRQTRNIASATGTGVPISRTEVMTIQRTGANWNSTGWTLQGQAPLVVTAVQGSGAGAMRSESIAVSDGANKAISLARNYITLPSGEALESETLGTSSAITANFNYYTDFTTPGSFGYLKSATISGGKWEAYEYYDTALVDSLQAGRIQRRFSAFGDFPAVPGMTQGQGEITEYEYGLDPFGFKTRPTKTLTTVNGVTLSWTDVSYDSTAMNGLVTATQSDHVSGHVLTTTRQFHSEGSSDTFTRGKTVYALKPNGVKDSYTYEWGTWDGSAFSTGAPPAGGGSASSAYSRISVTTTANGTAVEGKSTMAVTIRDPRALVIRRELHVWVGGAWQITSFTNFSYNFAGLLVARNSNNASVYEATYDGLQMTSETDDLGVMTTYTYDVAGRLLTRTRAGAGAVGTLATRFSYDAVGHVLEEQVGWGQAEKIISWRQYDDAGRLVAETPPGNFGAVTHTYDVANRSHTQRRADGSTVVNIHYLDGKTRTENGDGVVHKYHSYGVDATGSWHQVNVGGDSSPRWTKTWSDAVGRIVRSERPGFSGQPTVVEENIYSSTSGLRTTSTLTGYAPTLYVYDLLGQLVRSGRDRDTPGQLELASGDQIEDTDSYVELYNGSYWQRTSSVAYLKQNDNTPSTTRITRRKLTGFGVTELSSVETIDAEGNSTLEVTTVNRAAVSSTKTTTKSGIALAKVETSRSGFIISVADHDGLMHLQGYDALLRKSTATDSRSNTTTTAYVYGTNLIKTVTDGAGKTTTVGYDALGRTKWTRDQRNYYTYSEYTLRGELYRRWGDGAMPVEYGYDGTPGPAYGDRTVMKTFRNGSGWNANVWPANPGTSDVTNWAYDAPSGLLVSKTDANNKSVSYTYNARGQTATREWGRKISGDPNAERVKTTFTYGVTTGELLSQTYNDGTPSIVYTYSRTGLMETVTDVTGIRDLVYDSAKPWRLSAEAESGFYGGRVMTLLYESSGVVGRARGFQLGATAGSNSELEQTYGYSNSGRLEAVTSSRQTNAASRTFRYTYRTDAFLLQSLSIDGNHPFTITRTYETQRNLVTSLEAKWSTISRSKHAYTYDERGQRATAVQSGDVFADYGDVTSQQFDYDGEGQLTYAIGYLGDDTANANKQLPGRRHGYEYDRAGNRRSSTRTGVAGLHDEYETNALNQYVTRENNTIPASGIAATDSSPTATSPDEGATRVAVKGQTQRTGRQGSFWADELLVGNNDDPLTPHPWRGPLTFFSYKRGSGGSGNVFKTETRVAEIPGRVQNFTYDHDGNLLSDGVWDYKWDAENRLIEMRTADFALGGIAPLQYRRIELRYDYLGRRVQKRVLEGTPTSEVESLSRRFLYHGWNLIAEYGAPNGANIGNLLRSYAWGLDIARTLIDAGGVGALLQITDHVPTTARTYVPSYDGNGNVVALFDADASSSATACVAAYEYSPYGEFLRCEGMYAKENVFRFSTKFTDDETSLVYYGRRYYSPSQGRFLGRDPIEEQGGPNLYGFVGNNAMNGYDILGMIPAVINGRTYDVSPIPAQLLTQAVANNIYAQGGMWTGDPTRWGLSLAVIWRPGSGFGFRVNAFQYYYVALPMAPSTTPRPSTPTPGPSPTLSTPGNTASPGITGTSDLKTVMINLAGGGFPSNQVTLYYNPEAPGSNFANGETFTALANSVSGGMRTLDVTSAGSLISQLQLVRDMHDRSPSTFNLLTGIIVLDHSNPMDGPKFGGTVLGGDFYAAAAAALVPGGMRTIFFMNCSSFGDPNIVAQVAYYAQLHNLTVVGTDSLVTLSVGSNRSAHFFANAQGSNFNWIRITPGHGGDGPWITNLNASGVPISIPQPINPVSPTTGIPVTPPEHRLPPGWDRPPLRQQ